LRNGTHHPHDFLVEKLGLGRIRSLAIIGMGKNAGKTTVLNHILRAARKADCGRILAVTSIGLDGEEEDLVTGGVKPRIWIEEGTIVATAGASLSRCDATMEILAMTGIHTAAGEVAVARARSRGYVELAGPSIAGDLAECERICREIERDCLYLVDGALSRKSSAGGGLTESVVLAAGAANATSAEELARETARQVSFLTLPPIGEEEGEILRRVMRDHPCHRAIFLPAESLAGGGAASGRSLALPSLAGAGSEVAEALKDGDRVLLLRGAVTDRVVESLLSRSAFAEMVLVAEDGTRFFLSDRIIARMKQRSVSLAVLYRLSLPLICVNPTGRGGESINRDSLLEAIRRAVDVPVVDLGPALV